MYKPDARQFLISCFALVAGLGVGSLAVFSAIWWLTESRQAALLFTAPAVAFFMPVIAVFVVAAIRTLRRPSPSDADEPSRGTKLAAAAYALCLVPFWFASVGLAQGRTAVAFVLLVVYAFSAYVPLRAAYRLRLWANVQPSPK